MAKASTAALRLYPEWGAALTSTDQSRRAQRVRGLGREVGAEDVEQIASILKNGPDELKPAAAGLLSCFDR